MRYEVILDEEGYVQVIRHTGTVRDYVELDLGDYDLDNGKINAYTLGTDELIFHNDKWLEIQAEQTRKANEAEIKRLKEYLKDTDYIASKWADAAMQVTGSNTFVADMLAINRAYTVEYGDVLAERQDARDEINRLEPVGE